MPFNMEIFQSLKVDFLINCAFRIFIFLFWQNGEVNFLYFGMGFPCDDVDTLYNFCLLSRLKHVKGHFCNSERLDFVHV